MRVIVRLLAGFVLVIAVAWIGLWVYVQNRLDSGMKLALARMSANGSVQISYDSIAQSHWPLAASISLINPRWTFQANPSQPSVSISAATAGVSIDAFNPLVLHYIVPDQFNIITPRGNVVLSIGASSATASLDPRALFDHDVYPVTRADITATDLNILAAGNSLSVLQIGGFTMHEDVNAAANTVQPALNVTETFNDIALSPLLVQLSRIPFGGKISQFGFSAQVSGPANWQQNNLELNVLPPGGARRRYLMQAVHDWAAAGGNGKASLTLTVGPTTLNANGIAVFDTSAQPSGTADISADHLDAFSAALTSAYPQLQQSISNIEAQLSPYLSTTDAGGQVIAVHIAYSKSGVMVNSNRIAAMPPIDWLALENPPAPPPQAPGDGSGAASTGP